MKPFSRFALQQDCTSFVLISFVTIAYTILLSRNYSSVACAVVLSVL